MYIYSKVHTNEFWLEAITQEIIGRSQKSQKKGTTDNIHAFS